MKVSNSLRRAAPPVLFAFAMLLTESVLPGGDSVAQAEVLVANTGQSDDTGKCINTTNARGQAFTTGANALGYDLEDIVMHVEDAPDDWDDVTVRLARGAPRRAGALLDSGLVTVLVNPPSGAPNLGRGQRTWTLPSGTSVVLVPETQYTVEIGHDSDDECDFKIDSTNSDAEDGDSNANWSIADSHRHTSGNAGNAVGFWFNSTDAAALRIKVNGTLRRDTTAPTLLNATVAELVELSFSEELDEDSVPGTSAFTVLVEGVSRGVSAVSIDGRRVMLTLASPVGAGETVTISYAPPGANALRDEAENEVGAFVNRTVTNELVEGGVCDRTEQIRAKLVELGGVSGCLFVTGAMLASIENFDLSGKGIETFTAEDFDGLTSLKFLNLKNNDLSLDGLPGNGFQWLPLSIHSVDVAGNPGCPSHGNTCFAPTPIVTVGSGAPEDLVVRSGETVSMRVDLGGYAHPLGRTLSRSWGQKSGEHAGLSGSGSAASFVVPEVSSEEKARFNVTIEAEGDGRWRVGILNNFFQTATADSEEMTFLPSSVTVESIGLTSNPDTAGPDDDTYVPGDVVEATVTFSTAVTVTGTPELALSFDGAAKTAEYASGSGTRRLAFSYTVAPQDADADGIAIAANSLTRAGGTIKSGELPAALTHGAVAANPAHKVDGVRPTLSNAEMASGVGTVVLTFSEALDATNGPENADFTVEVGGNRATLDSTNAPSVSGRTVTLTLSTAVAAGQTVTVSYADPSTGNDANAVQDTAGNDAASFTDQEVSDTLVVAVRAVALTSDAGADRTYAPGDVVEATVTFNTPVTVTGAPELALSFDGTPKTAQYASGSGRSQLVFRYTVALNDVDADGIAIATDSLTLAGGTIKAGERPATLTHGAVAADAAHRADGVGPRPSVAGTTSDGRRVMLVFSEVLDATNGPANDDFTVKVGGSRATLNSRNAPSVSGNAVTLTLSTAVAAEETVTVSYKDPTAENDANAVQDAVGNDAASFTDEPVINTVVPPPPPTPSGMALVANTGQSDDTGKCINATNARGQAFTTGANALGYDLEDIVMHVEDAPDDWDDVTVRLARGAPRRAGALLDSGLVTVLVNPPSGAPNLGRGQRTWTLPSGTSVVLVPETQYTVEIGHDSDDECDFKIDSTNSDAEDGDSNANWSIADSHRHTSGNAGNAVGFWFNSTDAAALRIKVNGTLRRDTTAPTLLNATVAELVELSFSEELDEDSVPGTSAFTVLVEGVSRGVSAVSIDGRRVMLTLASPVGAGETVTISYAPPGANALRDEAENEVGAFVNRTVTNELVEGGVCDRTEQIRAKLVELGGVSGCLFVTGAMLASIENFDLSGKGIETFTAEDFDGLTSLKFLNLKNNDLSLDGLPGNGFQWLPLSIHSVDVAGNPGCPSHGNTCFAPTPIVTVGSGAPEDLVVRSGETVSMRVDLGGYAHPLGRTLSRSWGQKSGEHAGLSGSGSAASFVVPEVSSEEKARFNVTIEAEGDGRWRVGILNNFFQTATADSEEMTFLPVPQVTVEIAKDTVEPRDRTDFPTTEGNRSIIVVELSTAPEREVTVLLSFSTTALGCAAAAAETDYSVSVGRPGSTIESDWEAVSITNGAAGLTFGAEETRLFLGVKAIDDADSEPLESVRIGFGSALPLGMSAGSRNAVVVRILDNDGGSNAGSCTLSVSDATANEVDGSIGFPVTLSGSPAATVAVNYATKDESATAGADYEPAMGLLVFAVGETSKTVNVTLIDDSVPDDGETFMLELGEATGAAIADGTARGTIANAEAPGLEAEFPPSRFASARHTGASDRPQVVVSFSEPAAAYAKTTPSVEVTGGAVLSVARHAEDGLSDTWIFWLDPAGEEAMTFRLVADVACDAGGICTESGEQLVRVPGVRTIPGPATAAPVAASLTVEGSVSDGAFPVRVAFAQAVTGFSEAHLTAGHVGGGGASVTDLAEAQVRRAWTVRVAVEGAGRMWVRAAPAAFVAGGASVPTMLVIEVDTEGNVTVVTGPAAIAAAVAAPEDGAWDAGDAVEATLRYSEAVTVNTSDGIPSVGITVDGITRGAPYVGGSGARLRFAWTVPDGAAPRAVALSADSLALNGAKISGRGRDADLAHPGAELSLSAPQAAALTAAFSGVPSAHRGEGAFSLQLAFSEEVAVTEAVLQGANGEAGALTVAGGTMERLVQVEPGSSRHWTLRIEPDGEDTVTVTLAAIADCAAGNAVCTGDGRALAGAVSGAVPGPSAPATATDALTAAFQGVPATHGGPGSEPFSFQVLFSEPVAVSYRVLQGPDAFDVSGGNVTKSGRVGGRDDLRKVAVQPDGWDDVTVTLEPTGSCDDDGAICTADWRKLSNRQSATIQGPVAIDVADARVEEGPGVTLDFAVTLSRTHDAAITVDFATADGTAKAGEDYTKTEGTLTFDAGVTERTVAVPVLDDAVDEGEETMTLLLSDAEGARIRDGEAVGTIENSDAIPKAWLARFGRTVADHVVDAVGARFADPAGGGSHVTLGGRRIALDGRGAPAGIDEEAQRALAGGEAADGLASFAERMAGPSDDGAHGAAPGGSGWTLWDEDGAAGDSRTMSERELLLGSSFHLALGAGGEDAAAGDTAITAWGRAASLRFDGEADGLVLDGEVTTFTLGADAAWSHWLAGVAVSLSEGAGSYRDQGDGDRGSGALESTLTGVHPYARLEVSERLSLWGVLGFGSGRLDLEMDGKDGEDGERFTTDTSQEMAAVGARGVLVAAPAAGGLELALRTDAVVQRMTSDAATSPEGGKLAAADAQTSRLRLMLEGSHAIAVGEAGRLVPTLEVGLRQDGGDAETGTGVEVGGGLAWIDPATGLAVAAKLRGLVAHEDADYSEWGASGSVRIAPGADGRGLSLTLAPAWGAAEGGAARLWSHRDARAFAPENETQAGSRLEAELGYGFSVLGGRAVATPWAGMTRSETGGTLRLGQRLKRGPSEWRLETEFADDSRRFGAGWGYRLGGALDLTVEAMRREVANDNAPAHAIELRLRVRW